MNQPIVLAVFLTDTCSKFEISYLLKCFQTLEQILNKSNLVVFHKDWSKVPAKGTAQEIIY